MGFGTPALTHLCLQGNIHLGISCSHELSPGKLEHSCDWVTVPHPLGRVGSYWTCAACKVVTRVGPGSAWCKQPKDVLDVLCRAEDAPQPPRVTLLDTEWLFNKRNGEGSLDRWCLHLQSTGGKTTVPAGGEPTLHPSFF